LGNFRFSNWLIKPVFYSFYSLVEAVVSVVESETGGSGTEAGISLTGSEINVSEADATGSVSCSGSGAAGASVWLSVSG
jgi:hypothetical protein